MRFFIVIMKLCRICRKSYCFSLPWTMTTTGSLFFSLELPGLCGSGAYVFSSGTRNSRRDLGEVASSWITGVYRCRANRGRHIPSEKLKVVCRKVDTPIHVINADPPYLCILIQCLYCDHLWMDDFVGTAGRLHCNHAWLLLCWCVYGSPH